jgi:benzoyl-CoA reductase/2-hydroxyglutaryl-CoA dehydratase subunit BcrC/BadD/HgdB
VKDFRVAGVIELVEDFSAPRRWKTPFLAHALKEAGVPHVKISREYGFAPEVTGPLRTRIGAFLEMLELDR